eukprot:1426269-Prorocentrum_lima.AAC.1
MEPLNKFSYSVHMWPCIDCKRSSDGFSEEPDFEGSVNLPNIRREWISLHVIYTSPIKSPFY